MEKRIENVVEKVEIIHEFYCDECGEFIMRSEEYEDGYYADPKYPHVKVYVANHHWYKLNKCLCKECLTKINEELREFVEKLGFKKGD